MEAINLDALARPRIKVTLAGVEFELAPTELENVVLVTELQKKLEKTEDPQESIDGLNGLLAVIAPDLPIGKLQSAQAAKIVSVWLKEAVGVAETDGKDAKETLASPTSPG